MHKVDTPLRWSQLPRLLRRPEVHLKLMDFEGCAQVVGGGGIEIKNTLQVVEDHSGVSSGRE